MPELFFTAAEVAALLDPNDWDPILTEARARQSVDPDGAAVTIHDAVLRARRKG